MKTFISRIDGTVKNRADFPPTINETGGLLIVPDGETIPNIFRTCDEVTREKAAQLTIRTLSREWNINTELLEKIAYHFCSVDESDYFIDILDSETWDLNAAWETYCRNRYIMEEIESNPFV